MSKTVVITGANTGIGLATAHELAARGATVCLACRNPDKAEKARKAILTRTPSAQVELYSLDLSSFDHVRTFADEVSSRHDRIDVLINNAGAATRTQQYTAEGFDLQFGANYLAPFLLTHLLLPQLRTAAAATGDARTVQLASIAHNIGKIDPTTFRGFKTYRTMSSYGQSKLGNLMFNYALARRLPDGLTTSALHPGGVDSEVYRDLPAPLLAVVRKFLISVDRPAELITDLAVGAEYRSRSGEYHTAQWPNPVSRRARDEAAQDELYARSCELTGVEPLPVR